MNNHSRKLWFAAKRNFYYRDDPFRAALLCKQVIALSALSEEADEAKLLLHDIGLEIRKLAGVLKLPPASCRESGFSSCKVNRMRSLPLRKVTGNMLTPELAKRTVRLEMSAPVELHRPEDRSETAATGIKISVATAVVALPVIGIAQDGIVGIAVPEAAAVIMLTSLFWLFSKFRNFVKG